MKKLDSLNISDFFSIIRRRIWYLIITAIAVSAGVMVYESRLPSIYRSETTIVLSGRLVPEDYIRSLDRGGANERVDFVRQHIHSRSFLARIVQEFQLAGPGANLEAVAGSLGNRIEFIPVTQTSFKLAFVATDASFAQTVTRRLAEGVIQLNDSLRRERVQVVDQFLEEQAREAASQLAIAEEKLWEFRSQKFPGVTPGNTNAEDLRSLRSELASLETRLQAALTQKKSYERRLEERQQLKTVLTTPPPSNPARVPVASAAPAPPPSPPSPLEERLSRVRAELIVANSRYTSLHPEVVRLTKEIEELQALIKQSQPKVIETPSAIADDTPNQRPAPFPDLNLSVDLLQSEIESEIAQSAEEVAKLEQSKKTLLSRISQMETQLNPPPALSQQLATLDREYETAKQRYNYLTDKKFSSEMAARVDGGADNEIFKILDEASRPTSPVSPNRQLLRTVGVLAGLLFGFGAAFARELLDSSLHTAADAMAELKLPVLGGIPNVPTNPKVTSRKTLGLPEASGTSGSTMELRTFHLAEADSKIRDIIMDPLTPAGEPYRLMHAKLLTMQKQQGLKTILITSAMPGEGKTFAATCLAGVLARESGRKVLLVDGDLRTGSASRALGFNDFGIGLNELLDDTGDLVTLTNDLAERYPDCQVLPHITMLEASIFQCADVGLHFLPSGTTRDKPSHLLNTPQLEALINQAELIYDWIIIDSPPVLALADANILAPLCDGTVLVVRTGKTPSTLVKDAIQRIGTDRVCGLLMNRVRTAEAGYYYGALYGGSNVRKLRG